MSSGDDTNDEEEMFFVDFFNSVMDGREIPAVVNIRGRRMSALRARVREYGRETVKKMFRMAADSRFLNGGGKDGWVANFDWLIRPSNFRKVIEGNYNNKEYETRKNEPADNGGEDERQAEIDRLNELFEARRKQTT